MLQRLVFGLMYRIGVTPWEGHPLPAQLRRLVEGPDAFSPGRAIDSHDSGDPIQLHELRRL